jgi:hypothetical protein
MKQELQSVRFLTTVKIKEETNFCRDSEFSLELEDGILRVEDRRSHCVSFVPMHNIGFYKVKEEKAKQAQSVKK